MSRSKVLAALAMLVFATSAGAEQVFIHFEGMSPGDDVTGLGTLHPSVDVQPVNPLDPLTVIQTFYRGLPGEDPAKYVVYKAPNLNAWDDLHTNNALEDIFGNVVDSQAAHFIPGTTANGFANTECSWLDATDPKFCPQEFTVTFGNRRVQSFKILMVDYGDWNPTRQLDHQVFLRGFENGVEVAVPHVIDYDTDDTKMVPRYCTDLGYDLKTEADASACLQSGIGHSHIQVHAPPGSTGLDRIELQMGVGYDPNSAFDSLNIDFVNLVDVCPLPPWSCPNEMLNHDKCVTNGMVSAAVLGTGEFDVWDVDPTTCTLEGVANNGNWATVDVSRPYVGVLADENSCTSAGPDGYLDLTLEFDAGLMAAAFAGWPYGSLVKPQLVCTLTSGAVFTSEDIVMLVGQFP
jgi:hypothetical protein